MSAFPSESSFAEVDGLQIAYVDDGEGPPVWFMHGEPTWSYLWRGVWPHVRDAGFRCVVPDLAGFGRSDKPEDVGWYSYDRHVAVMAGLLEQLDLRGATMVVHDWGGPIGMRLFVEHPDRFDRLVVMDTGLFTGEQTMSDAWHAFRDFVEKTEDLPISFLVDGGTQRALTEDEKARYDEPFAAGPASKAGARAFPLMIPLDPEAPGAAAGRQVRDALAADARPKLLLWADGDPVIPLGAGRRFAELLGVDLHVVEGAGHFLQEDQPDEIGRLIASWLTSPPSP